MELIDIFDKQLCSRLDRKILKKMCLPNKAEIDYAIYMSLFYIFTHHNDFKDYMPFLNTYEQGSNNQLTISEEEAKMLGKYSFFGSVKENPIEKLNEINSLIQHGRNDFYDYMTNSLKRENEILDYLNYDFNKDTDTEKKDEKDLTGDFVTD